MTPAEAEFANAMKEIYRRAKVEAGYDATYFLRMLAELGPLATARRLIAMDRPSDGFTALWERGRLDLTVEAHVIKDRFESLFTDEEVEQSRRRLNDYGYRPPTER